MKLMFVPRYFTSVTSKDMPSPRTPNPEYVNEKEGEGGLSEEATSRAGEEKSTTGGDTPPKRTRGKGKVVIHKQLVSGGCCCGTDCALASYSRVRGRRGSATAMNREETMDTADPSGGPATSAFQAQMEAFVACMDRKLDQKFEALAKTADLEAMIVKVDSQAADISRLRFTIEDLRSSARQGRAELREEMKKYADDLVNGRSKKPQQREPMEEVEDCFDELEPLVESPPLGGNPRFRQTGVRFNAFDGGRNRGFQAGAKSAEQEKAQIEKYDRARRSLKIWPIAGRTREELESNLRDFLNRALGITGERMDELGIERMERTGIPDNETVHNELRIILSSTEARDYIYSRGPRLARYVDEDKKPTAGFRVEVPDYLAGEWRLLDDLGYRLKREHGPGTKKYIKYDDYNYSLYLEVRLPGSSNWTRISPESADRMKRKKDKEDLAHLIGGTGSRTQRINGEATTSANAVPLGQRKPARGSTEPATTTTTSMPTGGEWEPTRRTN